jgi:hypothetical protein
MIDLRSKARQRLLAYYFANPAARLHLRDLAGQLDIDPANLSKELRRLETEGLFRSEVNGRQKYFQLNRDYPLFAGALQSSLGGSATESQGTNYLQSSTCSPRTRWNSLPLLVIKVAPRLSAWAAIRVSRAPIGVPELSRAARTVP